jgi:hypothetical protein
MNGELKIVSPPGAGTVIDVRLPIAGPAAEPRPPA